MRLKQTDREALKAWEDYRKAVERATEVNINESALEKQKRIDFLKSDFESFCKYYFPNYTTADFADFHLDFANKIIAHSVIYITRAFPRDHAKSVEADLFIPIFLKFTGRLKNMLLVSYNEGNATELLMPLMVNLESNQRIINDYGVQRSSKWEAGNFKTAHGCSFRSIGTGQSPRGTRNDEARPDYIVVDDADEVNHRIAPAHELGQRRVVEQIAAHRFDVCFAR